MSITKQISKKRAAAGAALVALSGFVPQPLMQQAHAATATISVTGSFITGVQLTAGTNAKFGVLAATLANGKATLSTAGVVAPSKAVTVGNAEAAGSFILKVVSTVPDIDATVAGMGPVVLAASVGGAGPLGIVDLAKIFLGGVVALTTFTDPGGGTDKAVIVGGATAKSGAIDVGAQITWGAVAPIGAFVTPITLTMAF